MAKLSIESAMGKAKALERKGEPGQALRHYQAVLRAFPGNARARQAIERLATGAADRAAPPKAMLEEAMRLFRSGAAEQALMLSGQLIEAFPHSAHAWNLEGMLRGSTGDNGRAVEAFRRVIAISPVSAEAHNNLGLILLRGGETQAALTSLDNALTLKPDHPQAHNNRGNALLALADAEGAARSYRKAIEGDNSLYQAHVNLGHALRELGRLDEAIASYQNGLKLQPGDEELRSHCMHLRQSIADWTLYDERYEETAAGLGTGTKAVPPFNALALEDHAGRQMVRSAKWTRMKHRIAPGETRFAAAQTNSKIRIGYFSADFHEHATMFLLAGLLREHDRSRFEIHVYHYGEHEMGPWRELLTCHADTVREVNHLSDSALVELARADGLDIALDLKGYTRGNRSQVFASRVAPVQINYLGYPGTMGADFIDYLIADRIVVPERQREFYSEKIIYLPDSYQPNDDARAIVQTGSTRADFGLPDEGFVFCCFNQSYKIGPREFDIWMRLLGQVEGSVLWLLRSNRWAEDKLKCEAEKRGIPGERLVFADKAPHGEHLARHAHADLFLDTFAVNAHTTASDALWAGLPAVTRAGEQFAARVAASLLHAVGLDELVTETDADYERLILDLARDSERLRAIRSRLAGNRQTQGLFDTKRYARNFEKALMLVHERRASNLPPADLDIAAIG